MQSCWFCVFFWREAVAAVTPRSAPRAGRASSGPGGAGWVDGHRVRAGQRGAASSGPGGPGEPGREGPVEPASLGLAAAGGRQGPRPGVASDCPGTGSTTAAEGPCRLWPHTWWCFSQSLCWQKEPQ